MKDKKLKEARMEGKGGYLRIKGGVLSKDDVN